MSEPRYLWRQLNQKQREELLAWRKERRHPWHSPPHRPNFGHLRFLISTACYEHQHHIGKNLERMDNFTPDLLDVLPRTPAEQTRGVCCQTITTHSLKRRT